MLNKDRQTNNVCNIFFIITLLIMGILISKELSSCIQQLYLWIIFIFYPILETLSKISKTSKTISTKIKQYFMLNKNKQINIVWDIFFIITIILMGILITKELSSLIQQLYLWIIFIFYPILEKLSKLSKTISDDK